MADPDPPDQPVRRLALALPGFPHRQAPLALLCPALALPFTLWHGLHTREQRRWKEVRRLPSLWQSAGRTSQGKGTGQGRGEGQADGTNLARQGTESQEQ